MSAASTLSLAPSSAIKLSVFGLMFSSKSGLGYSLELAYCLANEERIGVSKVPPVQPPSSTTLALHRMFASIAISKSDLVPAQQAPIVNFLLLRLNMT